MATNVMNFKKFEVTGATKAEAIEKLSDVFSVNDGNVKGDATQAYKNWEKAQVNGITEASKKVFMAEYLAKKKAIAGEAYVITETPAVANTREKPYKVENVKNEEGRRDFDKAYNLIDEATGAILGTVSTTMGKVDKVVKDEEGNPVMKTVVKKDKDGNEIEVEVKETEKVEGKIRPTKTDANEAAKALILAGHRGNILIEEVRETKNPIVSKVLYTPSKSSKVGTYVVFGIEKN